MRSLLLSPPFARFICVPMWGPGVLPTALPAPLSATLSPALSVYLRKCRVAGSASARTACPVHPTLRQYQSCHSNRSPLHPGALLRPSYRSGRMFILYFLGVGPSCRSIFYQFCCARRRSVSTYAAILVLPQVLIINFISKWFCY